MLLQGEFKFPDEFVDNIFKGEFPWYLTQESSSSMFPFVGHSCIERGTSHINSWAWEVVEPILRKFVDEHELNVETIIRCNFNLTFPQPDYERSDMHVDNGSAHKVLVAYLNDCSGDTVVYKKTYDGKRAAILHADETPEDREELYRVSPKKGTAICFDGAHYHSAGFPSIGESRVVCVVNFITKD